MGGGDGGPTTDVADSRGSLRPHVDVANGGGGEGLASAPGWEEEIAKAGDNNARRTCTVEDDDGSGASSSTSGAPKRRIKVQGLCTDDEDNAKTTVKGKGAEQEEWQKR